MRDQHLRQSMKEQGIDGMVVTMPQNVFYFTGFRAYGFTHYEAFAVVPADGTEAALVIGHFGVLQVAASGDRALPVFTFDDTHFNAVFPSDCSSPIVPWPTAPGAEERLAAVLSRTQRTGAVDPVEALATALGSTGLSGARLAFDDLNLALRLEQDTRLTLRPEDARGLLQSVRLVKTSKELAAMKKAATLTQEAFREAVAAARPGAPTAEMARVFGTALARRGATTPIGAKGFGMAQMLHPTLECGALVPCAGIAVLDWYNTDMGRTLVVGPPTDDQRRIHGLLESAFDAVDERLRPGASTDEVFGVIEDSVRRGGGDPERLALYVHAIGLDSYDYGHNARQPGFLLEPNVTLCVYALYMAPEAGGAAFIEEGYVVGESGPEALYSIPRGLIQVSADGVRADGAVVAGTAGRS